MADREIDLMNAHLVGARGDRVVVQMHPFLPLTPEQALVHAAWLVVIASTLDPTLPPFGEVLTAVKST